MSKTLSVKYYQENKERLERKKKKRSNKMVVNFTKISKKMKIKSLLSIVKDIIERKTL